MLIHSSLIKQDNFNLSQDLFIPERRVEGIHRRGAEGAEEAQRLVLWNLRFEISNLRLLSSLRPLCALCASAVNAPYSTLKNE